jgi:RimJ/RimL family protein N-acetyltransferase
MLVGGSVRLRTWREDDLPVLTELRNDVEVQAQLLSRARGSRLEQVREWLQVRNAKSDGLLFVIADQVDDQAMGYVQVTELDLSNCHANLGICLIVKARGLGMGGQAIALLSAYLKAQWNIRKLSLQVRADNVQALRCYEKVGFERCGLLKSHFFISGSWQDVVLMERFLTKID